MIEPEAEENPYAAPKGQQRSIYEGCLASCLIGVFKLALYAWLLFLAMVAVGALVIAIRQFFFRGN